MGLIAVLAAALAAWCGAAIAGVSVGDWQLPALAYGLALVPGTVAAVRWPVRSTLTLPRWAVRALLGVGAAGLFVLFSAGMIATLLDLLPLAVIPLSLLWPRPGPLRASVVVSGACLVGPATSVAGSPLLVLGVLVGAAVALPASARLAHDQLRRTAKPIPGKERRTLTAAAAVLAVAVVAGLLATLLAPPGLPSPGSPGNRRGKRADIAAGQPPVPPAEGSTAPGDLALHDRYDLSPGPPSGKNPALLKVRAARPEVWRTQTFDDWDGRGWGRSPERAEPEPLSSDSEASWFVSSPANLDPVTGDYLPPMLFTDILVQRFTVEAPYIDVLAAASRPVRVLATSQEVHSDGLEAIRTGPPLGRGARYQVVSLISDPSEKQLRASDSQTSPAHRDALDTDSFLQLPGVSDRVRLLASEITAGAPTTYDKALAVERWLAANVRQAEASRPDLPDGADVVDTVLFVDRAATSDELATAMAVLLRAVGVPTRLGVGFLPGRRPPLGGDYVVRASDAHAWVEVGFGVAGWQPFDPSGRIAEAERADSPWVRFLRLLRQLAPLLALLAVAAAAYALWRLVVRRRHERSLPWVARFWGRVVKAGAGGGMPRHPSETPAEYTAALAGSVLPDERLRQVGTIVTDAAFSGREPPPETRSWAEDVLDQAVVAARRERRRARFRRRSRDRTPEEAGV